MTTFLQYLAHICCDSDDEDSRIQHQDGLVREPSLAVESSQMSRLPPSVGHSYQPVTNEPGQDEEEHHNDQESSADEDCCCRRNEGETTSCPPGGAPNDHGLHEFFRKLRERWRRYDSMETFPLASSTKQKYKAGLSPLRTAHSYNDSLDIPTISLDEVVMPGSELQKQMAKAASLNLEDHGEECVICMEGFDPTNPRMPTLCGCGQNKTYFHLPCLYQWIEQCEDCPSCRQKLRWEEF